MGIAEDILAATEKAAVEVQKKSITTIQYETAITWCGRSIVAHGIYAAGGSISMLLDAEEYGHEALEHAALAGPAVYQAVLYHLTNAKTRSGQ
jgi:hypothetical protein